MDVYTARKWTGRISQRSSSISPDISVDWVAEQNSFLLVTLGNERYSSLDFR